MKKKKALIILPSYTTGGAEKVIWTYFKNFKDSNISLKLLVVNAKDTSGNFKKKNIIKYAGVRRNCRGRLSYRYQLAVFYCSRRHRQCL